MSIFDETSSYSHPALVELHAGFDAASAVPLSTLDVDELDEFVIESYRAKQRAEGLFADAVQEATNQQVARRHGEPSLATHIAGQVHGNSKRIGAELSLCRWLYRFPQLHAALSTGQLTVAHMNELRALERKHPKAAPYMERAQDFFIDSAHKLQFPQWVDSVGYWFHAIDPDGVLTDPTDPKYGATVTTLPSGDVLVKMRLDPISGEAYITAVEHEEKKIFNHERDSAAADDDKLSPRQRTMTAIMRLIARGFQRKDGSFPEPMVQLVMSEKVAEDLLARLMGLLSPGADGPMDFDPFELPINYDDLDGRCETIRGTPIHPLHALVPLLLAKMRRLVIDDYNQATEEPDEVREFRFFTKKQRQTLLALTRGKCSVPGCHNPYSWLQMDHINPHINGGQTLLSNGQPLCQPHNKAKGGRAD